MSSHIQLKSFPGHSIILPEGTTILRQKSTHLKPLERDFLLNTCVDALNQMMTQAEQEKNQTVESLLLILPDKTRTQLATHLLIDAVLELKPQKPHLQVTLLYGLGTHPLMSDKDIQKILGRERYNALIEQGISWKQQSTRAMTNEMTTVTIWTDETETHLASSSLESLKHESQRLREKFKEQQGRPIESIFVGVSPQVSSKKLRGLKTVYESLAESLNDFGINIITDTEYPEIHEALDHALNNFNHHLVEVEQNSPEKRTINHSDLSFFIHAENDGKFRVLCGGHHYIITVPKMLFEHHLMIVAGDIKIHPYEGRYGSGGINKMLAVGVASMNEIRRSHSTKVLMNTDTRVGHENSPFVKLIETTANNIKEAMLHRSETQLMAAPYNLAVMGGHEQTILGMAWGQDENFRRDLARDVLQAYTVEVSTDFDVVISDVELNKATDITAGGRSLQYVCDWNTADNPLLKGAYQGRVALLFNPCNESQNNSGIGNDGTKKQLDVLGKITRIKAIETSQVIAKVSDLQQVLKILEEARYQVLRQWEQHLRVISEADDIFNTLHILAHQVKDCQKSGQNRFKAELKFKLKVSKYAGRQNEVSESLSEIQRMFLNSDIEKIIRFISNKKSLYAEHDGLGEGGQRALRLLSIFQNFNTFILATKNTAVIDYLQQLDPDLTPHLSPNLQGIFHQQQIRVSILGLRSIDMTHQGYQAAIDQAMQYAAWYNPSLEKPRVCFLADPLILKRKTDLDRHKATS